MMISNVRGYLKLNEADITQSEIDIEIDTSSIHTCDEQRDAHLRSPDFLDTERHPLLTFRSTKVEKASVDAIGLSRDIPASLRWLVEPIVRRVSRGSLCAHVPEDLIANAEAVFKQRDPEFEFPELPVELTVGNCRHVLFRGWIQLEGYEVFMEHGHYIGVPGHNECLAISLKGACSVS